MQQPLPLCWQHWVQSTGAQVPISGTSPLLCTGCAEDMEQLWHMRTQAWRTNHSPVLSSTTITQGIDYPPLPQLRASHRDLYTRTTDFLAAFSTTLDVVDTSQMTKKHSWPCKRDPPKDSQKPTPPCLKTTQGKHKSMQHCRDLTKGGAGSCI